MKILVGYAFDLSQSCLINNIINLLDLEPDTRGFSSPIYKKFPSRDKDGPPWKQFWDYHLAVGMLTYIQGPTRPDNFMTFQ